MSSPGITLLPSEIVHHGDRILLFVCPKINLDSKILSREISVDSTYGSEIANHFLDEIEVIDNTT